MSQTTPNRPNDLPPPIARALNDFLAVVEDTFGDRLVSAVLFGSAAEGRVRATSDVNLAIVTRTYTREDADRLREPLTLAHAAIALNVMFLVEDEVGAAAEAFAAKFADIIGPHAARHRLLVAIQPGPPTEVYAIDRTTGQPPRELRSS